MSVTIERRRELKKHEAAGDAMDFLQRLRHILRCEMFHTVGGHHGLKRRVRERQREHGAMGDPTGHALIAARSHDLRHVNAMRVHAPAQQRRHQQPFTGADIQGAANATGHHDLLCDAVKIATRFADAVI